MVNFTRKIRKATEGTLINVDIDLIKPSSFNPKIRTKKDHAEFRKLVTSIRKSGVIQPPTVTSRYKLIDGHRRHAVCKELGHKNMEVYRLSSKRTTKQSYDTLFTEAQTSMKLNVLQETERYLMGAKISKSTMTIIKFLENIGKRDLIKKIVKEQKSPISYKIALTMYSNYTSCKKSELKKVVYWLFNVGSPWKLKVAFAEYIPVKILRKHILTRTPITNKWSN